MARFEKLGGFAMINYSEVNIILVIETFSQRHPVSRWACIIHVLVNHENVSKVKITGTVLLQKFPYLI